MGALTWTPVTVTTPTSSTEVLNYFPDTLDLAWHKSHALLSRDCMGDTERHTLVDGNSSVSDRAIRWGDDDATRATFAYGSPGKITNYTWDGATFSIITHSQSMTMRDRHDINGQSIDPRMLANAPGLGTWYYPTPTHILIDGSGVPKPLTTEASSLPEVVANMYPRTIVRTTSNLTRGFGCENQRFWGNPTLVSGEMVTRMNSPPCKRYVAPVGSIISNRHVLYGLPPVVSVAVSAFGISGQSLSATVTQTQTDIFGNVLDSSVVASGSIGTIGSWLDGATTRIAMAAVVSGGGGGVAVAGAVQFSISAQVTIGVPASPISGLQVSTFNQIPCWNDGWAISGNVTEPGGYIPGYLMKVGT